MDLVDDDGARCFQRKNDLDVFSNEPRQESGQFANGLVGLQRERVADLFAAESKQLAGQAAGPLRSLQDLGAIHEKFFVARQLRRQQLSISSNHTQQVIEVVGHATGQDRKSVV